MRWPISTQKLKEEVGRAKIQDLEIIKLNFANLTTEIGHLACYGKHPCRTKRLSFCGRRSRRRLRSQPHVVVVSPHRTASHRGTDHSPVHFCRQNLELPKAAGRAIPFSPQASARMGRNPFKRRWPSSSGLARVLAPPVHLGGGFVPSNHIYVRALN